MIYFTLYSRSYCHLCDEMRLALEKLMGNFPHKIPYELTLSDVDENAVLLDLYDELVPVLFASRNAPNSSGAHVPPGEKLCHHFFDAHKVQAFLS